MGSKTLGTFQNSPRVRGHEKREWDDLQNWRHKKTACHRRDFQSNMSMTCGLNPMFPFNKGGIEEINHLFTSMLLTLHRRWLILPHCAVQIHSQQKTDNANCKWYAFIRKVYRNGMHQCFPATRSHNSFSTSWVNQKSPRRQVSDSYIVPCLSVEGLSKESASGIIQTCATEGAKNFRSL